MNSVGYKMACEVYCRLRENLDGGHLSMGERILCGGDIIGMDYMWNQRKGYELFVIEDDLSVEILEGERMPEQLDEISKYLYEFWTSVFQETYPGYDGNLGEHKGRWVKHG